MLEDVLLFLLGLGLVIGGADRVTVGATAIARRLRVSALVIGVTVVALGSSAPDLFVCVTSTLRHKPELALGDVVGANIFDILAAVGGVALVRPLAVGADLRRTDMPLLVLSCVALFVCGDDSLFDGTGSENVIDRSEGLLLLCLFVVFMTYTLRSARKAAQTGGDGGSDKPVEARPMAVWKAGAWLVAGFAALALGGNWVVDGSTALAERFGLSEGIVGLTIVALGSAAPDLATSLMAAWRGETGLALGNVVGACIFNVFFIIGLCATIEPLASGSITAVSYGTLVAGSVLLWVFATVFTKGRLTRLEGGLLVAAYFGYIVFLAVCRM